MQLLFVVDNNKVFYLLSPLYYFYMDCRGVAYGDGNVGKFEPFVISIKQM